MRPGPSLAGVRLVIPDRAMGLPVLRALSLCTCCRHYPGAATGRRLRSSRPAVSAFPENVVGSACTSSFSRLARRLLALRPAHSRSHLYVTSYTEGFSHFVTSMTAPVASGWSVRRVGLAPTGKRRLVTAHTYSGRSAPRPVDGTDGRKARLRGRLGKDRSAPERTVPSAHIHFHHPDICRGLTNGGRRLKAAMQPTDSVCHRRTYAISIRVPVPPLSRRLRWYWASASAGDSPTRAAKAASAPGSRASSFAKASA